MALPYDVDGTWVDTGASYTAGELRRADAAMFTSAGVSSGLAVSVDGSDVVTIQPGSVVISGEDAVVGTGVYRSGIAAAITGSLAARDATNARIDLVVFRQMDTDVVGSHGARTARIQIIPGTPSATPAVPSRPTMAVELARITVPAAGGGAASASSAFRPFASAVGGGIQLGASVLNFAASNTFTNQTTWATFPNSTDRTLLTRTLVKARAETSLHVAVAASCALGAGVAQKGFLGLRINGTDYEIARTRFLTAVARDHLVGFAQLAGIAAGSLTIEPVFKAETASAFTFWTADDMLSYTVREG